MTKNNAYIYFWKANFMYIGKGITTDIHDHHALQLIIDLDRQFELRSKAEGNIKLKAALIDSDRQHECVSDNDTMLILNISPESNIGKALKRNYLQDKDIYSISNKDTITFISTLLNSINADALPADIVAITEQYLYQLSNAQVPVDIDDRINAVLDLLAKNQDGIIKIKDIAAKVFLSESRLIHLFKKQVGVPMRKYILWLRLVKALQRCFIDDNITQVAMEAGFSDAPHFNKTLKRMFGLNLSGLKNSQFIQAWWI